ncbi:hypothetical protein HUS2011_pII0114 (plasmid) [Escherichia coli]|nr:hypothetical protein HUS2011_pII0114 [Escherichia coli]
MARLLPFLNIDTVLMFFFLPNRWIYESYPEYSKHRGGTYV